MHTHKRDRDSNRRDAHANSFASHASREDTSDDGRKRGGEAEGRLQMQQRIAKSRGKRTRMRERGKALPEKERERVKEGVAGRRNWKRGSQNRMTMGEEDEEEDFPSFRPHQLPLLSLFCTSLSLLQRCSKAFFSLSCSPSLLQSCCAAMEGSRGGEKEEKKRTTLEAARNASRAATFDEERPIDPTRI